MSEDASDSHPDSTLYNPPDKESEVVSSDDSEDELHLEIPQDLATQLLEVSMHLGLSPSIVASRAIVMVCDEIGIVQDRDLSTSTLIQKYQTRIDLLHSLDFDFESDSDEGDDPVGEFEWGEVDEIIERVNE